MARRRTTGLSWSHWLPWPITMALGAVGVALAGWLSMLAVTMLGWVTVPQVDVAEPVWLAAELWLLGHGSSITIAEQVISIAPLGFSLLWVFVGGMISNTTTHHALSSPPGEEERGRRTAQLSGVFIATYVVTVMIVGLTLNGAVPWRGMVGAAVLATVTGLMGVGRACRWRPTLQPWWLRLPAWIRALPQALFVGVMTMLAGGALAFVVALLSSQERFLELDAGLAPDTIGGILLLIIQLAWLPNMVLWATSWVTGAGFGLGQDTFVTPLANQSGILPNLPVFSVIPETGSASPWQALWLLVPVCAGVMTGLTLLRSIRSDLSIGFLRLGPAVRPDIAAIAGGFAGVVVGLTFVVLAALSGGDLGQVRLVNLGPLLGGLLILAPTTLGLSSLLAAAIAGWRQYRQQRPIAGHSR